MKHLKESGGCSSNAINKRRSSYKGCEEKSYSQSNYLPAYSKK